MCALKSTFYDSTELDKIPEFQKNKHRVYKGFSACYHNAKHDKTSYSKAETLFKQLCLSLGFREDIDFVHELKVRTLESKNHKTRTTTYHLDFYFPRTRINVEINPMFHYTYQPVVIRDKIKRKNLKRLGIKQYCVKAFIKCGKTTIETQKSLTILKKILSIETSHGALDHYIS